MIRTICIQSSLSSFGQTFLSFLNQKRIWKSFKFPPYTSEYPTDCQKCFHLYLNPRERVKKMRSPQLLLSPLTLMSHVKLQQNSKLYHLPRFHKRSLTWFISVEKIDPLFSVFWGESRNSHTNHQRSSFSKSSTSSMVASIKSSLIWTRGISLFFLHGGKRVFGK